MQPLLKIQTIPISLSLKTTNASLQQSTQLPAATVSKAKGGLSVESAPAQIKLDSTEMRASIGLKSPARMIREAASAGKTAAASAAKAYAQLGNRIVDSQGSSQPVIAAARSSVMSTSETIMAFSPSAPIEVSVVPHQLSLDFVMDQLRFDWHVSTRPTMEFVPGKVEVQVEQYPDVQIEYIGSPVYAPPSADPNYTAPASEK